MPRSSAKGERPAVEGRRAANASTEAFFLFAAVLYTIIGLPLMIYYMKRQADMIGQGRQFPRLEFDSCGDEINECLDSCQAPKEAAMIKREHSVERKYLHDESAKGRQVHVFYPCAYKSCKEAPSIYVDNKALLQDSFVSSLKFPYTDSTRCQVTQRVFDMLRRDIQGVSNVDVLSNLLTKYVKNEEKLLLCIFLAAVYTPYRDHHRFMAVNEKSGKSRMIQLYQQENDQEGPTISIATEHEGEAYVVPCVDRMDGDTLSIKTDMIFSRNISKTRTVGDRMVCCEIDFDRTEVSRHAMEL